MEWKSIRLKLAMLYCLSIFFFSALALFCTISTRTTYSDMRSCLLTGKADLYFQGQDVEKKIKENNKEEDITVSVGMRGVASRRLTRRYLSGPGSSPPRCTSKCGKCKPCKPVHVPVPPGTPVTAEYYPEAWRCKCGGKLYMP